MAKKKVIITSRIKKGSLIKYALDNIKKESFSVIQKELKSVLGDKLVKVGLATGIYGRLSGHSKSEKIEWDNVSLFVIKNIKYLRDVETAVNRIAKPKYSLQKGRVGDEHYLKRLLNKRVKEKTKKLNKTKRRKDSELRQLEHDILKIKEVIK